MKNNDVPPNASDHTLARKRLAIGLRNIVTGQMYALYVLALGAMFLCIAFVFRWEAGASFGLFLIFLWSVISAILATLGYLRLSSASLFLPFSIRLCVSNHHFIPSLFLLLVASRFVWDIILVYAFGIIFLLHGIIPQYFIARWLAKTAEEGTMEAVEDNPPV